MTLTLYALAFPHYYDAAISFYSAMQYENLPLQLLNNLISCSKINAIKCAYKSLIWNPSENDPAHVSNNGMSPVSFKRKDDQSIFDVIILIGGMCINRLHNLCKLFFIF